MKTNNTLLFFLILLSQIIFGQTVGEKKIQGKIIAETTAVGGINIVNDTSGRATITDENGMFSILAKEGDILVISALNLVTLRRRLNNSDLTLAVIEFQMIPKSIELKEVIVNEYPSISAENLGIVP
ncbi:MAG TPA: carboxypeptidase-like regulatory domain-containing protein, partial [Flavobacterium sp.]|uniref:carboxypeptidase-like regulatory domain-containing protein n=1 Tax=Flavobacterium sp. TaxID=239 RepID=UPI002F4097AC